MWKPMTALMVATAMLSGSAALAQPFPLPRPPFLPPPLPPRVRPFPPVPPVPPPHHRLSDLERQVERRIRAQFGWYVDYVDVDISSRSRRAEIDVELRDFFMRQQVSSFIYSMPELRGYRIRLDLDY